MSNEYYFKHDIYTSQDRRIKLIDFRYKGHGYSMYMKSLEYMALNNGFMELIDIDLLAASNNYKLDFLHKMFDYFIEIGLLYKTDDKIYSEVIPVNEEEFNNE